MNYHNIPLFYTSESERLLQVQSIDIKFSNNLFIGKEEKKKVLLVIV